MLSSRMILSLVWLLAALLAAGQTAPVGTARLTAEDVLRWRTASTPVLSPDGTRVAFLLSQNDFESSRTLTQLWWVDVKTRQARRLTQNVSAVSEPRWSPDGRWLAFLAAPRATVESRPEKKPSAQVWLLPADGGEAFPATQAADGVVQYRWAPDSQALYFVAPETAPGPVEALRERQRKRKLDARVMDEERPRKGIWRVALADRRVERLFPGDPGVDDLEPSPDGAWIVYRTNSTGDPDHSQKYDLWLLDLRSRAARQLTSREGEERSPVWSPDSTRVAFLAPRDPAIDYSQPEVFVVPINTEGSRVEPQRLTQSFSGNIERLRWPARGGGIYFAAAVRTGNHLYRLDPASGSVQAVAPEPEALTAPDWAADGKAGAALIEAPDALPEVALIAPGAPPQGLTDLNPQLKEFALGVQEVVSWKSKDGLDIEGVVVKPPGWQAAEKYPLLVFLHGGPYSRQANTLAATNFLRAWAARGWLVFAPNFRGSSAYGNEFGIANRGDIAGRDFQDILSGVDALVARGWADPDRMAVMGGSYGGYLTNWAIAQTKRFRAAVSMYGIFNLITDYSNSDYPSWETSYLKQFYWENLPLYLDRSPAKYVAQITTPILILHGDDDPNTFISNSKEMYQALKALNRPVKFVRFPREGHGIREPNHRLEQFELIAAWLDEHVLGRAEDSPRVAGEAVRSDPWELRLVAVLAPESFLGVNAQGRFLEVEFLIRARLPTTQRFSLVLFDTRGSEVFLESLQRQETFYPLGVVADSLGQHVLVKSSAQVVAFVPDRDGRHASMAVSVAFDVPADAREFALRVKNFPPLVIGLPGSAEGRPQEAAWRTR